MIFRNIKEYNHSKLLFQSCFLSRFQIYKFFKCNDHHQNWIDSKYFTSLLRSKDSVNINPSAERQTGILLEHLPSESCNIESIRHVFKSQGVQIENDDILFLKSRLGRHTGRALILTEEKIDDQIFRSLPNSYCTYRVLDTNEVSLFVEQCERYIYFSEDLHKLSNPGNFEKIITLSEVPKSYGRIELSDTIYQITNTRISPSNIIFRFSKNGIQSDTAWIICSNKESANHILSKIKEVAVPKKFQYGSLFGASFLWSSRNSLFISDADLDFTTYHSKYQVFTYGWQGDVSLDEFNSLVSHMKFFAKSIKKYYFEELNTSSFFMTFDRFKDAKIVMQRLHHLRKFWKLPPNDILYAYPRQSDVHWDFEDKYHDEDSANDSDLDEPIDY